MNYGKKGVYEKYRAATSNSAKVSKRVFVIGFKVIMLGMLFLTVFGFCVGIGVFQGIIESAPDISNVDVSPTGYSSMIYDAKGNETTKLVASGSNRIYVEIEDIPDDLQHAFVAIEDERFYEHNGIDAKGILRAAFVGLSSGTLSEGASTITQQLLKNNVFKDWTEERYFVEKLKRKLQEQYLALELEKTMDKPIILENYLNTINLGQNTLGVQAASKRYFNKDVSQLTLSECTVIAAITQNPSRFNPVRNPEENAVRREKVLHNMNEQGYISKEQMDEALADDVYLRIQNVNDETEVASPYTYYEDALIEQVLTDLVEQKGYSRTQAYNLVYSGGLSIYSAQDTDIQKICDEEFADADNFPSGTKVGLTYRLTVTHPDGTQENFSEKTLLNYFAEEDKDYTLIYKNKDRAKKAVDEYRKSIVSEGDKVDEVITYTPQPQASLVLMDYTTGHVKAIVGGRGTKEASLTLNRATETTRQPGSTFKVLAAFAPAIDSAGKTLSTTYVDEPYKYSNGRPVRNWYRGYRGTSTIRKAIEQSMNIVAVKCLTEITPQVGYDYLLNFGFTTLVESRKYADGTTKTDIAQPLALGGLTDGVTNLELTAAYATIANKGVYNKPVFYTKVVDHDGKVLLDNTKAHKRTVLKESTAYSLTTAMSDVVEKGTGKAVDFGKMPIAGKTGTTSQNYDVWFSGYTPYYACTVWGGYDINTTMDNTTYHKTLWKSVMERIHKDLKVKEFEVPDSMKKVKVCQKSGKLATSACPDVSTLYFEKDAAPTSVCKTHVETFTEGEENAQQKKAGSGEAVQTASPASKSAANGR